MLGEKEGDLLLLELLFICFLFFGKEVMNNGGRGLLGIYTGGGVPIKQKEGGLRCGHNPKEGGGVLGAATTRKRGVFGTGFETRQGPKN